MARLAEQGVRIVWAGDFDDIRGRHLHPRDVGGALVSLDEPVPAGSWRWGGPTWPTTDVSTAAVDRIASVTVGAEDPDALRSRWEELDLAEAVRFVPAGARGEGIDGVDLRSVDRSRVGERHTIGGVAFTFV